MKRTESFPTFCGRGLPSPQSDEFAFRATLLFVPITIDSTNNQPPENVDWLQGYCYQYWRCSPEGSFRADGAFGQFGVVLEKQAYLGGNTNFASGGMNAAGTK